MSVVLGRKIGLFFRKLIYLALHRLIIDDLVILVDVLSCDHQTMRITRIERRHRRSRLDPCLGV